jgi:hypothetical protein
VKTGVIICNKIWNLGVPRGLRVTPLTRAVLHLTGYHHNYLKGSP